MEITEHQANMLRALADKKTLQFREKARVGTTDFAEEFANISNLNSALLFIDSDNYEVRIKPDVIVVNGIEVPAPEKSEPARGVEYWIADPSTEDAVSGPFHWADVTDDRNWLRFGLVYLNAEAASAHGKAMRAHKPG